MEFYLTGIILTLVAAHELIYPMFLPQWKVALSKYDTRKSQSDIARKSDWGHKGNLILWAVVWAFQLSIILLPLLLRYDYTVDAYFAIYLNIGAMVYLLWKKSKLDKISPTSNNLLTNRDGLFARWYLLFLALESLIIHLYSIILSVIILFYEDSHTYDAWLALFVIYLVFGTFMMKKNVRLSFDSVLSKSKLAASTCISIRGTAYLMSATLWVIVLLMAIPKLANDFMQG